MLAEFGKSLGSFIEERLTSPLLSTFLLSWCAWNYKFLVILFSDTSISATFNLIDTVAFPTTASVLIRGFALPLFTTAAYIYVYPIPAKVVYEAWRRTQHELATIRHRYDDNTLLTIDQSRDIRARILAVQHDLDTAREQLAEAQKDVAGYQRRVVELESAAAIKEPIETPTSEELGRGPDREEIISPTKKLMLRPPVKPDGAFRIPTSEGAAVDELPESHVKFLQQIADRFGENLYWTDFYKSFAPSEQIFANYLIEDLLQRGFLSRFSSMDGEEKGVMFTQQGRKMLFDRRLQAGGLAPVFSTDAERPLAE